MARHRADPVPPSTSRPAAPPAAAPALRATPFRVPAVPGGPGATVPAGFPRPRRAGDAGTPARTAWVDAAKGICIVLVVLHHAVMFLQPQGLVPGPLFALNTALASLRMPLFFLASGLFLAAVLERPWRTLLHRRVALFAWLYLLWTGLQFGWFALLPAGTAPDIATQDVHALLLSPLLPAPSMWFLYALALFSVAARALRRVPAPVLLTVTAVASALAGAGTFTLGSMTWEFMARYAFFFVLGWHGRRIVERVAAASSSLRVIGAGVLAAGAAGAAVVLGVRDVPGVAFVLNLLAVGGGVLAAAELARLRVGRVAIALGRRTLPIYLTNSLLVGGLTALLVPVTAGAAVPAPVQYPLVALVTGLAVVATLGLHRALRAVRAGWLYDLPGPWAVRPATG